MVGSGFCKSRCQVMGGLCDPNGYSKRISNIDECQSTCENTTACTAFTVSDKNQSRKYCVIHGNISSSFFDSEVWTHYYSWPRGQSTFGYEGFKVTSSSGIRLDLKCYKRLNEELIHEGKFLNH